MSSTRQLVEALLREAGVTIEGSQPWDITVRDERLYARVMTDKNLGLGEAYMDGWWDCPRLDEFFYRVLKSRLEERVRGGWLHLLGYLPAILFNLQSPGRSRIIAECHYSLDRNLFLSFLDPYNQYSCAYFKGTDDLAQAQQNKLEMICRKIGLRRSDHVLDIGCGWGGFARYAAEHYGCRVTAVNISRDADPGRPGPGFGGPAQRRPRGPHRPSGCLSARAGNGGWFPPGGLFFVVSGSPSVKSFAARRTAPMR